MSFEIYPVSVADCLDNTVGIFDDDFLDFIIS